MHSIRTKITLLTVCAVIVSMTIATVLAAAAIKDLGTENSNQILRLLCETGQKNLDAYFESIQQSVETVSGYANSDLEHTDIADLGAHLDRVSEVFEKTASHTAGILTYYSRIDPEISQTDKGFWYVNLDGEGFKPHVVTDITQYDTSDQSALVWFTVPKTTGEAVWQQPYFTDNLYDKDNNGVYVVSYNVPIYKGDRFIGVIGIEIDYDTIIEPVKNISLYDNGYAFINDGAGTIIYHPHKKIEEFTGPDMPKTPTGLLMDNTYLKYTYEGVEKQAVWMPLSNGMRLYVTVPISEINASWRHLISEIIWVAIILVVVFSVITMRFAGHITKPLRELTAAAKQVNTGNYDFTLDYDGDDEVGLLTRTFKQLTAYLKSYINDLNGLAYADALTSVHNKGSFDIYVREMQTRLNNQEKNLEFAIAVFDCDGLKAINDQYGHDKGDAYLKAASSVICEVFHHSPVFRTGGDEFAAILQNDDFRNRKDLSRQFVENCTQLCADKSDRWEQVRVSIGIAAYNPIIDRSVDDVVRRADNLMYQNKRARKATEGDR
ncbi:MAG: diguanylate cyclase [Oscillospiraceae bacterium]|nr:diguanylate cyclase [Oscillospiraceae bacterium]